MDCRAGDRNRSQKSRGEPGSRSPEDGIRPRGPHDRNGSRERGRCPAQGERWHHDRDGWYDPSPGQHDRTARPAGRVAARHPASLRAPEDRAHLRREERRRRAPDRGDHHAADAIMALTATVEHTTTVTGADEAGKEINKAQWNGTGAHSV